LIRPGNTSVWTMPIYSQQPSRMPEDLSANFPTTSPSTKCSAPRNSCSPCPWNCSGSG